MQPEAASPRGRIAIAIGAAALLVAIVVAVSAIGAGGDEGVAPPPPPCVRSWNADPAALAYGRHNFTFHKYEGALVTFLSESGEQVSAGEGLCAVIFPSRALDPEPAAAGQVLSHRQWVPISTLDAITLTRLAELQVTAAGAPNTRLDVNGRLSEL